MEDDQVLGTNCENTVGHTASQKELAAKYWALGNFYNVQYACHQVMPCRSVLDIIRHDHYLTLIGDVEQITCRDLFQRTDPTGQNRPNAYIVMMNPGSSVPYEKREGDTLQGEIEDKDILQIPYSRDMSTAIIDNRMLPTHVDPVQYQWMRVMEEVKWQHVRILNLSDLRIANSDNFNYTLAFSCEFITSRKHSIFADSRKEELKCTGITRQGKQPICLAWGVSKDHSFADLVEYVYTRIPKPCRTIIGYQGDRKHVYKYPAIPDAKYNDAWVTEIVSQIKKKGLDIS